MIKPSQIENTAKPRGAKGNDGAVEEAKMRKGEKTQQSKSGLDPDSSGPVSETRSEVEPKNEALSEPLIESIRHRECVLPGKKKRKKTVQGKSGNTPVESKRQ